MSSTIEWLIVDWGTSNFRAFAMDSDGALIDKIERNMGLLQVEQGQFAQRLEQELRAWLGEYQQLPVFMAGMVGSAQGWVDVPYVETPVSIGQLAEQCHRFTLPWGAQAVIIPGVSTVDEHGIPDVMRGEEVQLFGLLALSGQSSLHAAFPGTHSKHIHAKDGQLLGFNTFMTGELFSVLSKHTILGRGLPEQQSAEPAFLRGVNESGSAVLSSRLFSTRTHRLFGNLPEEQVMDYLSGLIIGEELRQFDSKALQLVGGQGLCKRYALACRELGLDSQFVSGDEAFLAGMLKIKEVMSDDK
ncbi:2-dehydro-3-deoxygalactonokinase [Aliagarivorans marinus]|uniref:2-dehydro-3-deoxygalactonokinase n=1 Tax=Aliagarivorans marinus TaxID=561965 RepID=UPI0003F8EBE2|nr:2-dehydro-3-deoxygalactonokinase [Aliagarivorans marinus]